MKISELITILQRHLDKDGDMEVETPWEGQSELYLQSDAIYVTKCGTLALDAEDGSNRNHMARD